MSAEIPRRILVGVGNAGVAVLDRIAIEHPRMKGLMVINNDPESLASSVVTRRITFPQGDAEDGFLAIEQEFGLALGGALSVTFCGGLGGELGSFLLPALVARTKAMGITTLASVGMPFGFEGRQKRELALKAIEKIQGICDAVVVIDNERLSGGAPSMAAIGEAFQIADRTLQASLMALQGILSSSGPVKITKADLIALTSSSGAMTHFGYGRAEGANRLHEAFETAMKSPLLTLSGKGVKGASLKDVKTVFLLLQGSSDLSFAEVQRAVGEMERAVGEDCKIKVGVHADTSPGAPLEIFILASSGATLPSVKETEEISSSPLKPRKSDASRQHPQTALTGTRGEPESTAPTRTSKPVKANPAKQTQGFLDLNTYQRGRFDKSEPTIVAGEDLDIPTFLRKGIKLGSPQRH